MGIVSWEIVSWGIVPTRIAPQEIDYDTKQPPYKEIGDASDLGIDLGIVASREIDPGIVSFRRIDPGIDTFLASFYAERQLLPPMLRTPLLLLLLSPLLSPGIVYSLGGPQRPPGGPHQRQGRPSTPFAAKA